MKVIRRILTLTCALTIAAISLGQNSHAKISAAQAEKVALAKYHGKIVGKTNLENEEGKWQYAVNIRSGKTLREVMIDAKTGKIANVEVTTAKKESAEAKAEAKSKSKPHKPTGSHISREGKNR